MKSLKELKLALLNSMMKFEAAVYMVVVENKQYTLEQILNDEFDIELLKRRPNVYWKNASTS